ncbi:MAG: hypothetical protein ACREOO_31390 [bacterium]
MNCELSKADPMAVEELIENYAVGRLSEKEAEEFELHFLICDECFQRLKIREQVIRVVEEKGGTLFAGFIRGQDQTKAFNIFNAIRAGLVGIWSPGRRLWVYAAGATTTMLLAFLVSHLNKQDGLPAEGFQPYAYFEELIANQESKRSVQEFSLLSPSPNTSFKPNEEIWFRWQAPQNVPVSLEILNNKGERRHRYLVDKSEFHFNASLPAGLYYWKITTDDDYRIGRFFVR